MLWQEKQYFNSKLFLDVQSLKCMMNLLFDQRYILPPSDSLLETILGFYSIYDTRREKEKYEFSDAQDE